MSVRVRFAPSPTGPLHIGGVRTAFYNYLFAKKNNGTFILRIEDTDKNREVAGAENYIFNSLEWLGISPDESPKHGGDFGPYRQSERLELYQKYIQLLLENGAAYYAFDTPEELENLREECAKKGETFSYNSHWRASLKNSLTLGDNKAKELIKSSVPFVIRFKIPDIPSVELNDLIRGNFSVSTDELDDKILMKNDGFPTYHFANVVDDHLMQITHVIRGEEWLPSLPLHVLLYQALGWEPPKFAHLPLILKPEGKGKLSKRDGDALGFPVFPLEWKDPKTGEVAKGFREEGYFPEAVLNTLALLGWTPDAEQEILSKSEMIQQFDLEKVHKSGARFNPEKAKWINQQYLFQKSEDELLPEFIRLLEKKGFQPIGKERQIISYMKDRAHFISEMVEQSLFFYRSPQSYDNKAAEKFLTPENKKLLEQLLPLLNDLEDFTQNNIKHTISSFCEKNQLSTGKIMPPIRLLLVGEMRGPDVPVIIEILGKQEFLSRITKVLV